MAVGYIWRWLNYCLVWRSFGRRARGGGAACTAERWQQRGGGSAHMAAESMQCPLAQELMATLHVGPL
jgi:hypothetical protein